MRAFGFPSLFISFFCSSQTLALVAAFAMANRVTYRRRLSYNTKSNGVRHVKTPGSRLVVQYRQKMGSFPTCGDTGVKLLGVRLALISAQIAALTLLLLLLRSSRAFAPSSTALSRSARRR